MVDFGYLKKDFETNFSEFKLKLLLLLFEAIEKIPNKTAIPNINVAIKSLIDRLDIFI